MTWASGNRARSSHVCARVLQLIKTPKIVFYAVILVAVGYFAGPKIWREIVLLSDRSPVRTFELIQTSKDGDVLYTIEKYYLDNRYDDVTKEKINSVNVALNWRTGEVAQESIRANKDLVNIDIGYYVKGMIERDTHGISGYSQYSNNKSKDKYYEFLPVSEYRYGLEYRPSVSRINDSYLLLDAERPHSLRIECIYGLCILQKQRPDGLVYRVWMNKYAVSEWREILAFSQRFVDKRLSFKLRHGGTSDE